VYLAIFTNRGFLLSALSCGKPPSSLTPNNV
jgi:hypothetical protein